MKQTAVEWLIEYCDKEVGYIPIEIINKAKRMEKEQMKHAYHDDRPSLSYFESGKAFEQYYNETFKSE